MREKRRLGIACGLALAALVWLPGAAFAGFVLPVNPDRLNGAFGFEDRDQGPNNQMLFVLDGAEIGFFGQVVANAGLDVVTIAYFTEFPSKSAASEQSASVGQDRQVRIALELEPGIGSVTPAYFGQAAPTKCKAQAKLRDGEASDPDDPDKAQLKLSCDLGPDFSELDDDADPGSPGDPPEAVLTAVEEAFEARKDVKVQTNKGKLQIKQNGEPVPAP